MIKYLVGSKLYKLENTQDTDYIIILEEVPTGLYKQPILEDWIWRTLDQLRDRLSFKEYTVETLTNFQFDREMIDARFPIEYHILDYRENLIAMLKYIVDNQAFNFDMSIQSGDHCCTKMIYYIAYNVFILQNNSVHITPEQKAIIQRIHDRQMPISYINELAAMIAEL